MDIIATVAGYAATENYGVVGMSAKTATDAILKLVGSEANKKRGVKVSFLGEGDEVDIDLYVTMVYGVSLPVVAKNMIDNVRYRVQETTGIKVANVNIHVESISALFNQGRIPFNGLCMEDIDLNYTTINGALLKEMFLTGAALLEKN